MDWLALLTAFGLGSVVSAGVQSWLDARKEARRSRFSERKEAYLGLVESWVRQENIGISANSERDVGHWLLRCQFVASPNVFVLLSDWEHSAPGSTERSNATKLLKEAMRDDLR